MFAEVLEDAVKSPSTAASSSLDKAGLDFRQKAYLRMKTFCKNLYQNGFM